MTQAGSRRLFNSPIHQSTVVRVATGDHSRRLSPERVVKLNRAALLARGAEWLVDILMQRAEDDREMFALLRDAVAKEPSSVPEPSPVTREAEPEMVGCSAAMRRVFADIRKVARTDSPVLITGESGTGKELAALAIHERSAYASGPFVPINCGGLPANLIASELFGYEKAAFTGATQRKVGRVEAAQGGTVFLDEIGDLPLDLQPYLLRFLQTKTIDRLGGQQPIPVDVRVIAATNSDLDKAMHEGRFREDLYYRIKVLCIAMPALRERDGDAEILAKFFLRKFASEAGRPDMTFDAEMLALIRRYPWPGNVRELITCVRRAVTMSDDVMIRPVDLMLPEMDPATAGGGRGWDGSPSRPPVSDGRGTVPQLKTAVNELEATLVSRALAMHRHNISRAASDLGVSRVTFYRLMERHGFSRPSASEEAALSTLRHPDGPG